MAPRLPRSIVARIEDALQEPGVQLDELYLNRIAETYNVSLRTIYAHKSRLEAGCPVAPWSGGPRTVRGRDPGPLRTRGSAQMRPRREASGAKRCELPLRGRRVRLLRNGPSLGSWGRP